MTELEDKKSFDERSREHNETAKYLSSVIGNNLSLWICCAIPFLTVLFVWVDTSLPKLGMALLGEGVPVILLMVIGERLMVGIGARSGKTDGEYLSFCGRYSQAKDETIAGYGRMRASAFCEWYIEKEFWETRRKKIRKLRMNPREFDEKIQHMSKKQLLSKFGIGPRFFGVLNIKRLEYIYLTPDMIFDEETGAGQRGMGESGDEHVYRKTWGLKGILIAAITAACSVSIAMTLVSDPSWHRVLYTVIKLLVILYRMARGFNDGAQAYNKVEVAHKKQQIKFLQLYQEYCDNGGDKIGEVSAELGAHDHVIASESARDSKLHTPSSGDLRGACIRSPKQRGHHFAPMP